MRGIKYVSFAPNIGYGRAAREYMRQLVQRGIPLTWTPMVPGRGWGVWLEPFEGCEYPDSELTELVNRPIDYDLVIVHTTPEFLPRWKEEEAGKTIVCMTVWELDRLQPHWPGILNSASGVIVPCQWNRDVFRAEGVRVPMVVIPHVAPDAAPASPMQMKQIKPDDFVFYTISAWRERNAAHLTLEAYLRAFNAADPVTLILKTSHSNERQPYQGFWNYRVRRHFDTVARQVAAIRRKTRSTARVELMLDELTDTGIAAVHDRGDAYVSLTRCEGWGLGAFEAAWVGNPVLITGHGGQLDFLPEELSYLIDFRMVPYNNPFESQDEPVAGIGASWAEPDLVMAGRLMRDVVDSPDKARALGSRLQAFVHEHFATERTMDAMIDFLQELCPS